MRQREWKRCLVRNILKDRRMTQVDLARMIGMKKEQLNEYVNNKKEMSLGIARRISVALNCYIDDLYEWYED